MTFGVFCELVAISEDSLSVMVAENSMIGVSLRGCVLGFSDTENKPNGDLIFGESVESGLVAVRDKFKLAVMVMK